MTIGEGLGFWVGVGGWARRCVFAYLSKPKEEGGNVQTTPNQAGVRRCWVVSKDNQREHQMRLPSLFVFWGSPPTNV